MRLRARLAELEVQAMNKAVASLCRFRKALHAIEE